METFTPAALKQKSPLELLQMRKRVISELEANADGYEGREPSTQEKAFEERAESNVKTLDKVLEEQLREASANAAFAKYNGLGPRLTQRDMAAVDWVKNAITEKNPAGFTIEPRAPPKCRDVRLIRLMW